MAIFALLLLVIGLPIFAIAIYRAFHGQWWPLGALLCVPFVLFFGYSTSQSRNVQVSQPQLSTTEFRGSQGESVAAAAPTRTVAESSVSYSVSWAILVPTVGFLFLAVLAFKSYLEKQRPKRAQQEDEYGRRHSQQAGMSWGWAFVGMVVAAVVAAFMVWSAAYDEQATAVAKQEAEIARSEAKTATVAASNSAETGTFVPLPKNYSERPTAELWEKLTEARIDLSSDGESADKEKADEAEQDSAESEGDEESKEAEQLEQPKEGPPDWVKNPPEPIGNVYRVVTTSEVYSTEGECYDELEQKFYSELQRCMARILPKDEAALVNNRSVEEMGVPLNYIMQDICKDSYTEVVDVSIGPMQRVHVLMEFSSETQQELREKWISYRRGLGLTKVTKIFALLLASVGVGFVLLQVDTWTRGYYTKRLLVGLPVAIIAIALLLLA